MSAVDGRRRTGSSQRHVGPGRGTHLEAQHEVERALGQHGGAERQEVRVDAPHVLAHLRVGAADPLDVRVREVVVLEVLVAPPARADPKADAAKEPAVVLVAAALVEDVVVHQVVHQEAALLPQPAQRQRGEHEHGGAGPPAARVRGDQAARRRQEGVPQVEPRAEVVGH